MDIDMNLVAGITLGSFFLCFGCVCYLGERKRRKELKAAKEALAASATKVQTEVQAAVVISV